MQDLRPFESLAAYARGRDSLLANIVRLLDADKRVASAWLSGSFGRGEADEWADYDLHVAVHDADAVEFLRERPELYLRVGTPILVQEELPSDSMPGGWFQLVWFAGAIEVDWNIGPLSSAVRPLAFQMLVDHANVPIVAPEPLTAEERRRQAAGALAFFWAMAPIAIKYAGRRETRRAVRQVDLLSEAFISLARLATESGGCHPRLHATNRVLEPEIDARLARVGGTIDPISALAVIGSLCDEVARLHPAFAALDVSIPDAMPAEVERLRVLAASVAEASSDVPRTYR